MIMGFSNWLYASAVGFFLFCVCFLYIKEFIQ